MNVNHILAEMVQHVGMESMVTHASAEQDLEVDIVGII